MLRTDDDGSFAPVGVREILSSITLVLLVEFGSCADADAESLFGGRPRFRPVLVGCALEVGAAGVCRLGSCRGNCRLEIDVAREDLVEREEGICGRGAILGAAIGNDRPKSAVWTL